MSGFLRFLGIVNAAIWLGAGVFFSIFILPGVFSTGMHQALKLPDGPQGSYVSGVIAQVLFKRFFALQYICGVVAILHLFAEKLYLGRKVPRFGLAIVVGILTLSLMGGLAMQPKMHELHEQANLSTLRQEQRDEARKSFGRLHGVSQLANLLIMAGLLVHLVRVTRPDDTSRYITFSKFWG